MRKKYFVDVPHRNVSSGQSRPIITVKKVERGTSPSICRGLPQWRIMVFASKIHFFLLVGGKRGKVGDIAIKYFRRAGLYYFSLRLKYDFYRNTFLKTQCKKSIVAKCRVIQIVVSLYESYYKWSSSIEKTFKFAMLLRPLSYYPEYLLIFLTSLPINIWIMNGGKEELKKIFTSLNFSFIIYLIFLCIAFEYILLYSYIFVKYKQVLLLR